MSKLIGRIEERSILENALTSNRAELVAIYGRRRVGKTFLIKEVYAKHIAFAFTGVHKAKMPEQLENFSREMKRAANSPGDLAVPKNWPAAFEILRTFLEPIVKRKRTVIFFDEFPWINSQKSNFLKAFDHFWNTWASKYENLTVVICGSAASWMIQNVIYNRGGLHNRVTQRMLLLPFTLKETEDYLKSNSINLDRYQILQLYMVMGGVPEYLSKIQSGESATAAIDRICFTQHGYLTKEFENLYASLFDHSVNHTAVVRLLAGIRQGLTRKEIVRQSKISSGGTITDVLKELADSGFIMTYDPFEKISKEKVYRLTDEFSLFYLKYMEGQKATGKGTWLRINKSQTWTSWSGYAYESICFKHESQIKDAIGLTGAYVEVSIWRHIPRAGAPGAQIDLLLDRDDRCINLCEIKFSTGEFTINSNYATELENKRDVFIAETKTKKTIFLTMITTYGTAKNDNYNRLISKELTMNDLFK